MAKVIAPDASPKNPPPAVPKSPTRTSMSLPPLITSTPARPNHPRISSYAKNRLSTFSNTSNSQVRSRPQSSVFPFFLSSLSYTLVRDFAYPSFHPLHYGPQQEAPSQVSTPASESHKRLSDPSLNWDSRMSQFSRASGQDYNDDGTEEHLPQSSFGDGPPWSEDEDLQSPIVTSASSKHKKHKSNVVGFDQARGRRREYVGGPQGMYTGTNGDGSQTYYVSDQNEAANGPGGEYITYPVDSAGNPVITHDMQPNTSNPYGMPRGGGVRKMSAHFYGPNEDDEDGEENTYNNSANRSSYPYLYNSSMAAGDESRYSRDYQFTIASPDEEMHGKAVALFDFARENENELPLVEGQVILVSYRHGQGWLVAQDPKTGESGLVPEEYVRLLRDIEGGWRGLMNGAAGVNSTGDGNGGGNGVGSTSGAMFDLSTSPNADSNDYSAFSPEARTPTQMEPHPSFANQMLASTVSASALSNLNLTTNTGTVAGSAGTGVTGSTSPEVSSASTTGSGSGSNSNSNNKGEYYPPVVSHFSTTSDDLRPYPGPTHSPTEAPPAVRRPSTDTQRVCAGN